MKFHSLQVLLNAYLAVKSHHAMSGASAPNFDWGGAGHTGHTLIIYDVFGAQCTFVIFLRLSVFFRLGRGGAAPSQFFWGGRPPPCPPPPVPTPLHVRCHNYSFQRGAPHTLLIAVDAKMCIAAASPVNGSNHVVRSTSCSHTANSSKERPTRQSVVCSKRGICRKSCYHCKHGMLKPAVLLEPCCELYHTKLNCQVVIK